MLGVGGLWGWVEEGFCLPGLLIGMAGKSLILLELVCHSSFS